MEKLARRALVALLCLTGGAAAAEPVLFYNASLFTGTGPAASAGWFVVEDGRFVAVGQGAAPPAAWASPLAVDLEGAFVAPGFVDAHVHLVEGGMGLLQEDLSQLSDEEALAAALARVCAARVGGWCLARNLPPELFAGREPGEVLEPLAGEGPAYIALPGGHLAWVNRAGMEALGLGARLADPPGGRIHRDEAGRATGLLEDAAAWDALRTIYAAMPLDRVAAAILAAQERALRFGITAVGDNTFFPTHLKQYERLERLGLLHLRVAARAYGPEPMSRFLMRSVENERISFFGEKYFVDDSLSPAGTAGSSSPGGSPRYRREQLEQMLLDAGPYGSAFHVQGREGAALLAEARLAVAGRRPASAVDVLDHCGDCGDPVLLGKLRDAGLLLTILPSQLHDLPSLEASYGDAVEHLLPFRAFFAHGLEPALTSDWPYGYTGAIDDPEGLLGLAPLAQVAVAVSGRSPAGEAIPGAARRTVEVAEALRGITRNGARAVGRAELGRIEAEAAADFVILDRSPFSAEPAALYRIEVEETWIGGRSVYRRGAPPRTAPALPAAVASRPLGLTPSPIIGYDPTVGLILGGALFFYPYEPSGWIGKAELKAAPSQATLKVDGEIGYRTGALLSPHLRAGFDSWHGRHYGLGNDSRAGDGFDTDPLSAAVSPGVRFSFSREVEAGLYLSYAYLQEGEAARIREVAGVFAGEVEGDYLGPRLELSYDTRDNIFFARRGAFLEAWAEGWILQGGARAPRLRFGAGAARFLSLYAPDWVLALRANAGATVGDRGYWTDFALGGLHQLRGYTKDRFRGDHAVDGSAELRFPIWRLVSGAAFVDAGSVWVQGAPPPERPLLWSAGGGIRIGLPPDHLIRLRVDLAFGENESELFVTFGEAF